MTAGQPLLITFGVYLIAMILIGLWAWRSTRSFDDYILGGRSLGSVVTALSAGASDMSGWLLMGLPGALYLGGVSEAWIALGLVIGAWCNWKFVAGPLRVYTERTRNALTLPDYFTHRFEDRSKVLRVFSAIVILVFFAVYCASGIVAGARLFESVFGVPYAQALWWGAAATILYTLIGGFLAVSWTDTVQASLMIFARVLTPIMVVLGSLSALGYGPLAGVTVFGMQFLDFFDFLTNSVMMPIAAIATCLLVSRVIGVEQIAQEVEQDGQRFRRKPVFNFMIRWLCPIFAAIILASSVANAFGWIAM